jgi:pyrimidine operon attenuation protein/uracil phosphoribosyltransferase
MSRPSTTTDGRIILDAAGLARKVEGLSKAIAKEFSSRQDEVALIGIQTRGVTLAHRVAEQLKREWKREIPVGTLDITLYRDDVHAIADQPEVKETVIPFDIEHRTLILVDDVLFTGRTVRSAMNALIDYGRPSCIRLAVLIDRGHRELPVGPDYVGISLATKPNDVVDVNFSEIDKEDSVRMHRKK